MTKHYRRGDPETGIFWIIAILIVLGLFILGAVVPWITSQLQSLLP